jgi:Putative lumazine-binding
MQRRSLLKHALFGASLLATQSALANRTGMQHPAKTNRKRSRKMKVLANHTQILDCLRSYVDGAISGKSESIRSVMHADAQIFGYLDGQLLAGPMKILYDYVDGHPGAGSVLRWAVTRVEETNGVGSARVILENWHGHNFTDYFTLLKLDGRWKIINKVFSHE